MIEPVTTAAALIGGHRLVAVAEWVYSRRAGERIERELIATGRSLPPGGEISEIRADGSRWRIRVPASPHR